MPEETAVMDAPSVDETSTDDLAGFDYTKYSYAFPDGTQEYFTQVFKAQSFGWKSRARTVLRLHAAHEMVKSLEEELITLSQTIPRSHSPAKSSTIAPREGLRAFLVSLSDERLQQLCTEKAVSWSSFMPAGAPDKAGLIEALCDEMLG